MSNVFYMVYLDGQNNHPTYKHKDELSAIAEAKLLTKLTGFKAYVLVTKRLIEFTQYRETELIKLDEDLSF